MSKFHIAAFLLCLFTVSLARTTPGANDATTTQVSLPFPSADLAFGVTTDADANANAKTEMELNSAVPFPEVTFRPVNRRFNQRSKRPCRHPFKFYPKMWRNEEISYGNDMILSSGENSDFEQPIVRGEGNRIRGRWVRMHHHQHHHHDSDSEDEDRVKKVVFRHFDHDSFGREKELNKLREDFRVHSEVEKKKKGGFMRRVRKFLDNYF